MRICCASQSEIADDPRVRNQVEALRAAGHEVVAVGYTGGQSAPLAEPTQLIPPWSRTRGTKVVIATHVLGGRAITGDVISVFNRLPGSSEFRDAVGQVPADLYIANDWRALPAVHWAANKHKARYAYDAAEWSIGEFSERPMWRLVFPSFIEEIERRFINGAAFVSTVGPGLARLFQQRYDLKRRPVVIRNLPPYQEMPLREPGPIINVLYHGQFLPNRGLEQLIRSVPLWPKTLRLQLRGSGPAAYERRLRRLAHSLDVEDCVNFSGSATMTKLVQLANLADIGIHPLQDVSEQTHYSLPNKLFEYIMAGLAVCASNLPDIREVVDSYGVGVTISESSPSGIAEAVCQLANDDCIDFKRRSLLAARVLSWGNEARTLNEVVARVLGGC